MTMTLESLRGRILDLDSHEQIPQARYPEFFGERGRRFLEVSAGMFEMIERIAEVNSPGDGLHINVPDTAEITEQVVWEKKGAGAPAHADLDRRPAVLDAMGIKRQLVFPTMGLAALSQTQGGLNMGYLRVASPEEKAVAWDALDAYNDWAAAVTSKHSDRLRVAAILPTHKPGATPEWMAQEARRLIKAGVKAIHVPVGAPPAGVSPDDPKLDPFYAALAEANVALVTHPPSAVGFLSEAWGVVGNGVTWHHMADEYFVSVMVMGGVFERHPTLRFGVIEAGASWVGPLAELMDFWSDSNAHPPGFRPEYKLSLKPSEYLARNVRVTPFNYEPVEMWFQRWPNLQDVFCYSTDYPHPEGRPWSLKQFYANVSPLGDKIIEKFFCTNGELLVA